MCEREVERWSYSISMNENAIKYVCKKGNKRIGMVEKNIQKKKALGTTEG